MDDAGHPVPAQHPGHRAPVGDAGGDEGDVVGYPSGHPGRQVVEDHDRVPVGAQPPHHVPADVPGAAGDEPRHAPTPCSFNGPTAKPRSRHVATSRGSAPRVARQQPGTAVTSESCSSTVPPPIRSASTVRYTESGVARAIQSSPQAVHSTGVSPSRRVAPIVAPVRTPYGGRYHRTCSPVTWLIASRPRARSAYVARGPRASS